MGTYLTADSDLTYKQQRFVEEYLQDPKRIARGAAVRAGYSRTSAYVMASNMLKLPHIRKAIEEGEKELAKTYAIDKDRIMQELAKIGFANMQDYAELIEEGKSLKDIPREAAAALKEMTIDTTDDGRLTTKKAKITLADKRQALIDMGRQIGMFKEKHEITGVVTLQQLVEESLKQEAIEGEFTEVVALERVNEPSS